jgi:hypothetical protein
MPGHLDGLVPGDGKRKLVGQLHDGLAHGPLDALRPVVPREVQEKHEAGRALDQGADS